ncbi:MAG: hypothetical protein C4518_04560 [Desulfobacteraceae bacterium]|nr:MAG: hypothetical protein C4518_04560 [Desulfobacteraceae bacterium]
MKNVEETFWKKIAESNHWPEIIYLKDIGKLPCFPYSNGGFRNRVTGAKADPVLSAAVFGVGRYRAIMCGVIVPWLDEKTKTLKEKEN